MLCNKNKMIGI